MEIALKGHTSEETAYVVNDYPYGFILRTKIRYWIETKGKSGCGQRFCSQTLNPKTNKWNKPKKGTYHVVIGMLINNDGHVQYKCLSSGGWDKEDKIQAFEQFFSPLSEYETKAIRYIRATNKASEIIKWEIKPGEQTQTKEEQQAIYNKALAWGYKQL